jgi:hypothetical protein
MAALEASPRADTFEESPSSSMIAGSGTTMVQCRLSTREVTMESEERRMLASKTRMV